MKAPPQPSSMSHGISGEARLAGLGLSGRSAFAVTYRHENDLTAFFDQSVYGNVAFKSPRGSGQQATSFAGGVRRWVSPA